MSGPARDRRAVIAGAVTAAVMIAQQVASKATRDALFLSSYGASWLPTVVILSAALSVFGVLAMGGLLGRYGPHRVAPAAFLASGGLFAVEWFLLPTLPLQVSFAVYLHIAAFGSIVISAFWSVINERFDPFAAKRSVARIGIGATAGGVLGGVTAERVAALSSVRSMLIVLATMSIGCAVGVVFIGHGPAARSVGPARPKASGVATLKKTPYLQQLALLVTVIAISGTCLDYALKASAAEELTDGPALMQFFAVFYTVAGVGSFVLQTTLAKRALGKLGLAGTIAILPLGTLVLGTLGAAIPRLGVMIVSRGVETLLGNSLFRSGYELLYTPLPPEEKRASKTIVDVAFERLGDALGSGVILLLLMAVPVGGPDVRAAMVVAVIAAGLGLAVARRLHDGYVGALAESLRTGVVELDQADALDATTKRTLSDTTMALDREKLLSEIEALRERRGEKPSAPRRRSERPERKGEVDPAIARRVKALCSEDDDEVRQALSSGPLSPSLAGHIIPLVARPALSSEAIAALRGIAPRIIGQLVDALLDEEQPFVVRRRVPRVLSSCGSPRAVDGLLAGLADPRFEVRYQCAQALAAIKDRSQALEPDREVVLGAVIRELDVGSKVWDRRSLLDEEAQSEWLEDVLRKRVHRGLEHVFTLLGLVLDRNVLRMALRALESGEQALRGTALEYLENVLPETIRRRLWSHLGEGASGAKRPRPRDEVIDDLLRSMDSLEIDREKLLE